MRHARLAYQPFRSADVNLRPLGPPWRNEAIITLAFGTNVHPFGLLQACYTLQHETIVGPPFELHDGLEVICRGDGFEGRDWRIAGRDQPVGRSINCSGDHHQIPFFTR